MKTYLFTMNPTRWYWDDLDHTIDVIAQTGSVAQSWSAASHKKIQPGDRAFLMRLGVEPKGIIGAGFVTSYPYLAPPCSGENKLRYRVKIDFEVLLNPDKEPLLSLDLIKLGGLENYNWSPRSSGVEIPQRYVDELEALWNEFLKMRGVEHNPFK